MSGPVGVDATLLARQCLLERQDLDVVLSVVVGFQQSTTIVYHNLNAGIVID